MSVPDTPSSLWVETSDTTQCELPSGPVTEKTITVQSVDSSEFAHEESFLSLEPELSHDKPSKQFNYASNLQSNEGYHSNETQTTIFQSKNTEAFVASKTEILENDVSVPTYVVLTELSSKPALEVVKTAAVNNDTTGIAQANTIQQTLAGFLQNQQLLQSMSEEKQQLLQSILSQNSVQLPSSTLSQIPPSQQLPSSTLSQNPPSEQLPSSTCTSSIPMNLQFQQVPHSGHMQERQLNKSITSLPRNIQTEGTSSKQTTLPVMQAVKTNSMKMPQEGPSSMLSQSLHFQQIQFSEQTKEHQLNQSIVYTPQNIQTSRAPIKKTPLLEMRKTNTMGICQEGPSSSLLQRQHFQQGAQFNRSAKPKVLEAKGQTKSQKAAVQLNETFKMPYPVSKDRTPMKMATKPIPRILNQGRSTTATSLKRAHTEDLATECPPPKMKIHNNFQPKIAKRATSSIPQQRIVNVTESHLPINNEPKRLPRPPLSEECLLMLQRNGVTIAAVRRSNN